MTRLLCADLNVNCVQQVPQAVLKKCETPLQHLRVQLYLGTDFAVKQQIVHTRCWYSMRRNCEGLLHCAMVG